MAGEDKEEGEGRGEGRGEEVVVDWRGCAAEGLLV